MFPAPQHPPGEPAEQERQRPLLRIPVRERDRYHIHSPPASILSQALPGHILSPIAESRQGGTWWYTPSFFRGGVACPRRGVGMLNSQAPMATPKRGHATIPYPCPIGCSRLTR